MSEITLHMDEKTHEELSQIVELLGAEDEEEALRRLIEERAAYERRGHALHEAQRLVREGALDIELLMDKRNYRR